MATGAHRSLSDRSQGLIVLATVTCLLLLVLEIALRLVGYGEPYTREDPFLGFEGTNRAYRVQDGADERCTCRARTNGI